MPSPFYIAPTDDGPRGTYDVREIGFRDSTDDGEDEVVFNGTLDDCRAEYPRAPRREA